MRFKVVDGVSVTDPVRTAYDLARSPEHVEAVIAVDALAHRHGFPVETLLEYPARRGNSRGCDRLEAVVADADARSESPPETRTRLILMASSLPVPVPQYTVLDERGRFVARVDFGWPELKIAVEYQGDHHRTDKKQWRRDATRAADLGAVGWLLLPITAHDLFVDPVGLIRRIAAAVRRRTRELGVAL